MIQQAINQGLSLTAFLAQQTAAYKRGTEIRALKKQRQQLEESIPKAKESMGGNIDDPVMEKLTKQYLDVTDKLLALGEQGNYQRSEEFLKGHGLDKYYNREESVKPETTIPETMKTQSEQIAKWKAIYADDEDKRSVADASLARSQAAREETLMRQNPELRFRGGERVDLSMFNERVRKQIEDQLGGMS